MFMNIIGLFIFLVVAFLVIGFIAVLIKPADKEEDDAANDDYPRVMVSQEVPSVFDKKK